MRCAVLYVSFPGRDALLSGCCGLASDIADVIDASDRLRADLNTTAFKLDSTIGDRLVFLTSLEFPKSENLRLACPAPSPTPISGLSLTDQEVAGANTLLSMMVSGVDEPALPETFR
jgi:hypothetical protein